MLVLMCRFWKCFQWVTEEFFLPASAPGYLALGALAKQDDPVWAINSFASVVDFCTHKGIISVIKEVVQVFSAWLIPIIWSWLLPFTCLSVSSLISANIIFLSKIDIFFCSFLSCVMWKHCLTLGNFLGFCHLCRSSVRCHRIREMPFR